MFALLQKLSVQVRWKIKGPIFYKFSNHDKNKFILLLRKGVYPNEYMNDCGKFNETSIPEKKKDVYSHLNVEDITAKDYAHVKRICKDFEIKKSRRISWFVCSKKYIIVGWYIWQL